MRTQQFGIEMEMTGITRERAAQVIAGHFGTTSHFRGGVYDAYEATDRQGRVWKAVSDASITCQKKTVSGGKVIAGRSYSCEVVSPILTYADITDLQEVVRQLRHAGAFVNKSCGIHIHVDASKHTPATLTNLVNLMAQKEDILYRALQIAPDRLQYCKKVNENLLEVINRRKPQTLPELADMWYAGFMIRGMRITTVVDIVVLIYTPPLPKGQSSLGCSTPLPMRGRLNPIFSFVWHSVSRHSARKKPVAEGA